MGADQQFCLRWNNFHTNITSAFESLRDDEDFVDITLACEGRQVKAHKMVLSACSPYFRSLLKGNPCQHPIVFLKDVTFANLASILDFMYHGEVNVSHNELATFLKTAEALKVRGLAEDDKRKDSDGYNDASSPGPPRDPPDPGSPRPDETSATDTHLSESPPPHKKRRRSGTSVQSAEDTNETVISEIRETSVKNEPQEFNDEDDILGHSVDTGGDIKTDNVGVSTSSVASGGNDEGEDRSNFGLSDSVTISRSQAAMQQLQESFGSFLPAMSQSSGFLSHGATDMPRPPFPLEGVQGLPPGISTLPGPSMSQAGASQDTSQGEGDKDKLDCTYCGKNCSSRYNLKKHIRDIHLNKGNKFVCQQCSRTYSSLNSLQVHRSVTHPTGNRRRHHQSSGRRRSISRVRSSDEISLDQESKDDHDVEDTFYLSPKGQCDHGDYKSPPDEEFRTDDNSMQSRSDQITPAPNANSPRIIDHNVSSHSSSLVEDISTSSQPHASSPSFHGEMSPHFSTPISPQLSASMSPQMRTPTVSPHSILPSHLNLSSNQFPPPYHQTQSRISSHHQTSSLSSLQHKPSAKNNNNPPSSMAAYPSHFKRTSHQHSFHHHLSSSQHMPSSYQMHSSPSFSPVTSPFSTDEMPYNQNDSEDITPFSHPSLNT